jgi:uncharacterized protein (DUF608 family)
VNGLRPEGRPDTTSMQSEEHWTGVNYHVAAAMIVEVMNVSAAHG